MKIRIIMESPEELDLINRIRTGVGRYINWLEQKFHKNDISCIETKKGLVVIGDEKYEETILDIIENAKNGAYEMM